MAVHANTATLTDRLLVTCLRKLLKDWENPHDQENMIEEGQEIMFTPGSPFQKRPVFATVGAQSPGWSTMAVHITVRTRFEPRIEPPPDLSPRPPSARTHACHAVAALPALPSHRPRRRRPCRTACHRRQPRTPSRRLRRPGPRLQDGSGQRGGSRLPCPKRWRAASPRRGRRGTAPHARHSQSPRAVCLVGSGACVTARQYKCCPTSE